MWVVDLDTLRFIDVNQATIDHYGYSRKEFLTMTLRDIRPGEELTSLERDLAEDKTNPASRRTATHQKKNGELISVELRIAPFQYNGAPTNIVIASDITERLQYVKAVETQNEKLIAISWMQSHVIRAPLARIMGLLPMFSDPKTCRKEKKDILGYLIDSADELDEVIKKISEATSVVAVK